MDYFDFLHETTPIKMVSQFLSFLGVYKLHFDERGFDEDLPRYAQICTESPEGPLDSVTGFVVLTIP